MKKRKGLGRKTASKKAAAKKAPMRKAAGPVKKPKKLVRPRVKGMKCCRNCPDFRYCDERGYCCDYCDFYLNAKCTFGKKKGIPSVNQEIELPDYRGDDYGIDDYEAYEPVYE